MSIFTRTTLFFLTYLLMTISYFLLYDLPSLYAFFDTAVSKHLVNGFLFSFLFAFVLLGHWFITCEV
jgi:hypothetical protein